MSTAPLGRLAKVDLRDAWQSEAGDFTPWLAQAENIALLGEAIGLEVEVEAQEKDVGPFRADILCRNTASGAWVLVENQLERTDHIHLGQLLTYAAGLNAVTIVWIAARFTEEHRAALDWLNDITDERFNFFGLEVELWRIGDSAIAPKFNVVSKPNDWTRSVCDAAKGISETALTDTQRLQLDFWAGFRAHMLAQGSAVRPTRALKQNWMWMAIGRSWCKLMATISTWSSETQAWGPGEVRAELHLTDEDAGAYFQLLAREKAAIEAAFGEPLIWYTKPGVRSCRIGVMRGADLQDRDTWPELFEWLRVKLEALDGTFRERVRGLSPDDWQADAAAEPAP
jgi:hypothetical protein